MSTLDTRFPLDERAAYLEEIRNYLPAFLSSATSEQHDPISDVSDLLNLRAQDLERVVAVHVLLADEVRAFVGALPQGLRHPASSSTRPLIATQGVRGPIDWGATVRYRSSVGLAEHVFVVRPAERVFDTPENRALVWLIERLKTLSLKVAPADTDVPATVHNAEWWQELLAMSAALQVTRRFAWLRNVPGEAPNARTLKRLYSARTRFYAEIIPAAISFLRQYEAPSDEAISDLICRRYFEPQRDWQLFEIVVALRLARAFATVAASKRRARMLVGGGRAPYARYQLANGSEVRLWYQSWPLDTGPSAHGWASRRYDIRAGSPRPDIVLELVGPSGQTTDAVILELKATRSAAYLSQGLSQLLAYLLDRPILFVNSPAGWLVAPMSTAFQSRDPEDGLLWAVDASAVADSAVLRLAGLQASLK